RVGTLGTHNWATCAQNKLHDPALRMARRGGRERAGASLGSSSIRLPVWAVVRRDTSAGHSRKLNESRGGRNSTVFIFCFAVPSSSSNFVEISNLSAGYIGTM
ncbi:unnamed protein product, partial [Amoebophrya sp. A25]